MFVVRLQRIFSEALKPYYEPLKSKIQNKKPPMWRLFLKYFQFKETLKVDTKSRKAQSKLHQQSANITRQLRYQNDVGRCNDPF